MVWDASAAGRGVVWVKAVAAGSPPEDLLDNAKLQDRGLLPPVRRHCLMAIQVGPPGASGWGMLGRWLCKYVCNLFELILVLGN